MLHSATTNTLLMQTIAIPVKGSIFRHARAGDFIELTDTRGRERTLHIVEVDRSCCVCTNDRTGYVIEGTKLHLLRERELLCEDVVDALPEVDIALSLSAGDDLLLTPAHVPGKPAEDNEDEVVRQPRRSVAHFRQSSRMRGPVSEFSLTTARLRVSSVRRTEKAANLGSK